MIKSVIIPLERAINGVPGMKYMASDAGNDGEATYRWYLTSVPIPTGFIKRAEPCGFGS